MAFLRYLPGAGGFTDAGFGSSASQMLGGYGGVSRAPSWAGEAPTYPGSPTTMPGGQMGGGALRGKNIATGGTTSNSMFGGGGWGAPPMAGMPAPGMGTMGGGMGSMGGGFNPLSTLGGGTRPAPGGGWSAGGGATPFVGGGGLGGAMPAVGASGGFQDTGGFAPSPAGQIGEPPMPGSYDPRMERARSARGGMTPSRPTFPGVNQGTYTGRRQPVGGTTPKQSPPMRDTAPEMSTPLTPAPQPPMSILPGDDSWRYDSEDPRFKEYHAGRPDPAQQFADMLKRERADYFKRPGATQAGWAEQQRYY